MHMQQRNLQEDQTITHMSDDDIRRSDELWRQQYSNPCWTKYLKKDKIHSSKRSCQQKKTVVSLRKAKQYVEHRSTGDLKSTADNGESRRRYTMAAGGNKSGLSSNDQHLNTESVSPAKANRAAFISSSVLASEQKVKIDSIEDVLGKNVYGEDVDSKTKKLSKMFDDSSSNDIRHGGNGNNTEGWENDGVSRSSSTKSHHRVSKPEPPSYCLGFQYSFTPRDTHLILNITQSGKIPKIIGQYIFSKIYAKVSVGNGKSISATLVKSKRDRSFSTATLTFKVDDRTVVCQKCLDIELLAKDGFFRRTCLASWKISLSKCSNETNTVFRKYTDNL